MMQHESGRPNVLIVISDQLAQRAVGCYRDPVREEAGVVATPHMDALAARGRRFSRAYCSYPLCLPSRASFWSSLLPHRTGIDSNGQDCPIPPFPEERPTLGTCFRDAGYRCVHFGKEHDAGSLRGFERVADGRESFPALPGLPVNADSFRDAHTVRRATAWLRGVDELAPPGPEPFCCVVDLQNPHNICGWVGAYRDAHDDDPIDRPLPRLLDNHVIEDWGRRPRPIQHICCAHNRQAQSAVWNESNFRHYLAAYYHFVEEADRSLAAVLEALDAGGHGGDTLVVFCADHGDSMGAHRLVTKHTSFYEETVRVPWIVAGPGVPADGRLVDAPLVSLLDLLPTLCQACSIAVPEGLDGLGQWGWLAGNGQDEAREAVISQWHSEWGFTVEPGRMLCTGRYKYTVYREGDGEEFFDLAVDPGETRSLIDDPASVGELERHRRLFADYCRSFEDPFFDLDWQAADRWRAHPPGPMHHRGLAAPETIQGERRAGSA